MPKRMVFLLAVAICGVGFEAPFGILATGHAQADSRTDDALADLHDATAHAPMMGALRGELLPLLNSARNDAKAGNDRAAGEALLEFTNLLRLRGGDIPSEQADSLVTSAQTIIQAMFTYAYASDYAGLPIAQPILDIDDDDVDWRTQGVVSNVKDQGSCEADYAFSVSGAIESASAIETGTLVGLSAQQLIDCVDTNQGCTSGSPVRALEEVELTGIARELFYPYLFAEGACQPFDAAVSISDFARGDPGNEGALRSLVQTRGPVSAVLRIRSSAWDSYQSGVFEEPAPDSLPRFVAVLIVGYGVQGSTPYWIVKATYGTGWGMNGYAFIRRGTQELRIADFVLLPII